MPQYVITAPNGKKYKITGETREGALTALKKHLNVSAPPTPASDGVPPKADMLPVPQPEMSWGDTALDAAKSFGTGVGQGVIGLAGLPGDVGRFFGNAVGRGVSMVMGVPPEQRAQNEARVNAIMDASPLSAPTSESLTKAVESVTGPMYRPKGKIGRYANTTGQFAAGAFAGPGGVARKAAATVIPAVLSEGAGQATEGSALEPYARVGGALVGGIAATARSSAGAKKLLNEAPTRETVRVEKDAAYKAIDNAGIVFDQNAYKSAAMKIKSGLANKGWDTLQGGEIAPLVNRVNAILKPRSVANWTKIDGILKDAKAIMRSNATETTKMHAGIIVDQLEQLVKTGKITSKSKMTRPEMNATIDKARELARRDILAREIDTMKRRLPGYLAGDESGFRNQFGAYLKSPEGASLTPTERAAFAKVVRREGPLNIAHNLGSRWGQIAGGSTGSVIGGMLGSSLGPAGTAAGAVAGAGVNMAIQNLFRKFMEVYTEKGVDEAMKTVLAGRSAQEKIAVQNMLAKQLRLQPLLSAQSGGISANQPFLVDAKGNQYPYPAPAVRGQ